MAIDFRCYPSDDREFVDTVTRLVRDIAADDTVALTDALADLRVFYPDARIVRQSGLATLPGIEPVVYIYRDGALVKDAAP